MTISDINRLPYIDFNYMGRNSEQTYNISLTNKDTDVELIITDLTRISIVSEFRMAVKLDITIDEQLDFYNSINENTLLSIYIFKQGHAGETETAIPLFRDLITFKTNMGTESDYLESDYSSEYTFLYE